MVYVVLGMHKSGTTLVAETLHRSGIPMVEATSDADYESGNKWERASTLAFDKDLLAAHDLDSLSLSPPDPVSLQRDIHLEAGRRLVARIEADTAVTGRAAGSWGFKDPRACLTWPLWRRILTSPRIVGVYREPGAVVAHFLQHAARVHRTGPFWRLRVEWLALRRWSEHNERLLDAIAEAPGDAILLSYERLMAGDAELERLGRFLGGSLVDARQGPRQSARGTRGGRAHRRAWVARLAGAGPVLATLARLEAKRAEPIAANAPR